MTEQNYSSDDDTDSIKLKEKKQSKKSNKKKHALSERKERGPLDLFARISKLEDHDVQSNTKRRRVLNTTAASRSRAVKSQYDLHSKLIELRILMQRTIQHQQSQPLPASADNDEDSEEEDSDCGVDEESSERYKEASIQMLRKLMISRDELMTPCLLKVANVDRSADDDSESSDDDLQSTIRKGYNQCRGAWKLLLDKRHDDLKLHSGLTSSSKSKFQELEKGLWDQIQATVAHERVMGQDSAADTNHSSVRTFDDGKVYQNMLRDFISSGVSNQGNSSNDAASERLKAFQAKLLKKKSNGSNRPNKPDVDRKASKGRKLRYVVHPKLTNFTFPIMRVEPAIHENDWFKSIFGGVSSRK